MPRKSKIRHQPGAKVVRYLIINAEGYRLCNDWKWRSFAHFGDYSICVREYKNKGSAIRKAGHIGGQVVEWVEGLHIEAGGSCYFVDEVSATHERVRHVRLTDYVIWPPEFVCTKGA